MLIGSKFYTLVGYCVLGLPYNKEWAQLDDVLGFSVNRSVMEELGQKSCFSVCVLMVKSMYNPIIFLILSLFMILPFHRQWDILV